MVDLVNPYILELTTYRPGKPIEELKREHNIERVVKLASNENPFPLPGNVSDAIKNEISSVCYYPDSDSFYLRKRIAEYNGVGSENISVGAGLVEVISMIVRAFLKPGEKVLTSEKTFMFYKFATIGSGGKEAFVEARMDEDYVINLNRMSQMIDDKTKIIFIANPNNPTGTRLSKESLTKLEKKIRKRSRIRAQLSFLWMGPI